MASAAITVDNPSTIESDTNEAIITKKNATQRGYLVNGGTVKTFLKFNGTTVPTTDVQAAGVVGLPPGASVEIPKQIETIAHKTAATATVLYWFPASDVD